MNISDNSIQQPESIAQEITNQDNTNQNPGKSGQTEKGVQNPGADDKSRKEQVLARINNEPGDEDKPVNDNNKITNKDSKVTNAPQKDIQKSGNNSGYDNREPDKNKGTANSNKNDNRPENKNGN